MRQMARMLHALTTSLLVVCVVVQVFLAGLGVFDDPATFLTHAGFGDPSASCRSRADHGGAREGGRRQVGLAALTVGLMALQSVFVGFRADMPAVAALHPVNGFLIGLVAVVMARAAWIAVRTPEPRPRVRSARPAR